MDIPALKDVAKYNFTRSAAEQVGPAVVNVVQTGLKEPSTIGTGIGGFATAAAYAWWFGIPLFALSTPVLVAAAPGALVGMYTGMYCGTYYNEWKARKEAAKKSIDQIMMRGETIWIQSGKPIPPGVAKTTYLRMRDLIRDDGKQIEWLILDNLRVECNSFGATLCYELFLLLLVESANGKWSVIAKCEVCGRRLQLNNVCVCPIVYHEEAKRTWTVHCRENDGNCCKVKKTDVGNTTETKDPVKNFDSVA